jgi:hypothetical protein
MGTAANSQGIEPDTKFPASSIAKNGPTSSAWNNARAHNVQEWCARAQKTTVQFLTESSLTGPSSPHYCTKQPRKFSTLDHFRSEKQARLTVWEAERGQDSFHAAAGKKPAPNGLT